MNETAETESGTRPRRCSVCRHPRRNSIDAELDAGSSVRLVAQTHQLGRSSVHRHRKDCERPAASGLSAAGDWLPVFPGQRPPFAPGNDLAVTHGAYSPKRVDPVAERLVAERLADPATSWLRQVAYLPAVWAWARAEARVLLLDAWLQRHAAPEVAGADHEGDSDETGDGCVGCKVCAPVASFLLTWENSAARHRARLGLDPVARAQLGKDVAAAQVDMARLLSGLDGGGGGGV